MAEASGQSLLARLDEWQRARPDSVVVTDYDVHASRAIGSPVVRSSVTARELWDTVLAVAASLRSRGIREGDAIAVQLPTWHEYLAAHLAAYAVGAVTVPISPIYRARDLGRQLALSGAKALVIPGAYGNFDYVGMAAGLRAEVPSLQLVVAVGNEPSSGAVLWRELVAGGGAESCCADREAIARGEFVRPVEAFMLLNFTSGTTGVPKGVMHSCATVCAAVGAGIDRMRLSRDDVLFVAVTLGHAGGFLNGIFMPLLLQAKVVYMDLWDAGVGLAIIERERVTYGPMMPTYLFDLVRHPGFGRADIGSWRKARVSGGAISRAMMASLQERLPALRLFPGWGMSETLYATCGGPDDPPAKRNQTEGRPLAGVAIEIRDGSFLQRLGVDVDGEIVVRAPSVMLGYYRQDELTRAAFTDDGWLKTGDLGHLDADGYLVMVGRSKDIIVRGGENVPAVEVENLLMEHAKVASAVVIGVADPRLGEKVCVVVECKNLADPLTFDEMRSYLVARELTKHFIPEHLVLVDSLPKTPVGKVKKHEVRALVAGKLAPVNREALNKSPPCAFETKTE